MMAGLGGLLLSRARPGRWLVPTGPASRVAGRSRWLVSRARAAGWPVEAGSAV